jgi:uncharacterized iron-regulated membrane protein
MQNYWDNGSSLVAVGAWLLWQQRKRAKNNRYDKKGVWRQEILALSTCLFDHAGSFLAPPLCPQHPKNQQRQT